MHDPHEPLSKLRVLLHSAETTIDPDQIDAILAGITPSDPIRPVAVEYIAQHTEHLLGHILQGCPTPPKWTALCAWLERIQDVDTVDMIVSKIGHILDTWPDTLCTTPLAWLRSKHPLHNFHTHPLWRLPRSVALQGCSFTSHTTGLGDFKHALEAPNVHTVVLRGCSFGTFAQRAPVRSLQHIRHLHVHGGGFYGTHRDLKHLFQHTADCLHTLALEKVNLPSHILIDLVRTPWPKPLQALALCNMSIGPELIELLCEAQPARNIVSLDLSKNSIDSASVHELAMSSFANHVESLQLDHNRIGPTAMESLGAFPRLQKLHISSNPIEGWGLAEFARTKPSLKMLHAASCHIDDHGLKTFLEETNTHALERLNLRSNPIGDRGANALAEAAPKLQRLKTLNLRTCEVGPSGARALCCADFPALRWFILRGNPIENDGVRALANSTFLHGLEEIDLSHCAFGESGARELFASLRFSTMRTLRLRGNRFGNRALSLLWATQLPQTLRELDLSATALNPTAFSTLSATCSIEILHANHSFLNGEDLDTLLDRNVFPKLRTLSLKRLKISDHSDAEVQEMLKTHRSLLEEWSFSSYSYKDKYDPAP